MNATLSLDLDNKWSYMKTHGDPGWESFPSYLDLVVPRFLDFLAARRLRITVFVVGQDAELEKNAQALESIAAAGHEVGNHSFHHEPWLHRRSEEEIDREIARAEAVIEDVTGRRPLGFRGPGFTRSETILRVLARRGYAYDASTLPTWIGPLARAYYFKTAKLDASSMREREALFGKLADGLARNRFHRVETSAGALAEIPVTTMPILRVPIHVSYLLYLSAVSPALARRYFGFALALCRITNTEPSILLHPLDFLGGDDCPELAFFPAMNMRAKEKLEIVDFACNTLAES
ncbi:MAG: polysaccharide deacetylase family protein, partial [bacterium]|nr:polysaccharide deacetylase family protein [bacterium]